MHMNGLADQFFCQRVAGIFMRMYRCFRNGAKQFAALAVAQLVMLMHNDRTRR